MISTQFTYSAVTGLRFENPSSMDKLDNALKGNYGRQVKRKAYKTIVEAFKKNQK